MSSYTDVTISSEFKNLELATDATTMREFFQAGLSRLWGTSLKIGALFIPRVSSRTLDGFSIQYQMNVQGRSGSSEERIRLSAHLLGPGEPVPDYVGDHSENSLIFEKIGLVAPVFPYDPKLPQILEFVTNSFGEYNDQPTCLEPLGADVRVTDLRVLGYRLERRLSLGLKVAITENSSLTERRIALKLLKPKASQRLVENLAFLQENGFTAKEPDRLTVPKILFSDINFGVIATDWTEGVSIHDIVEPSVIHEACGSAGEIARKLHAIQAGDQDSRTAQDEIDELERKVSLATRILPQWADIFKRSLRSLKEEKHRMNSAPTVVSHRDYYDKQVLYSQNGATLLDCDSLTLADPALDVGNFLAHLTLRSLQNPSLREIYTAGALKFLDMYNDTEFDLSDRINWWKASSLVRLATLYCLRPRWRGLTPALLDEALTITEENTMVKGRIT